MKFTYSQSRRVITVVAVLALLVATAYAFLVGRNTKTAPVPTLPEAYEKALEALGAQTNAFYCLSANAMDRTDTSAPTEWHLVFYSTNGQLREVVVATSRQAIVREKLRTDF